MPTIILYAELKRDNCEVATAERTEQLNGGHGQSADVGYKPPLCMYHNELTRDLQLPVNMLVTD